MADLTIIILAKNEGSNIEEAVRNGRQCTDDVLVIDSGSTDGTVELAERAGARVVYRAWDDDFAAQRNFALTQTEAKWVLYLDADERMDEKMCEHVRSIVSTGVAGQYAMVRHMVFDGFRFRHGIFAPDTVYRMFLRDTVTWVGKVHEHPECHSSKQSLAGIVDHYTYESWHQWLQKADHYTSIWASESFERGKRTTLSGAFCHAFFGGLRVLLVKAAFLDGWMGILSCGQHAFYTMLKYVKLYELQHNAKKDIK